MAKVITVRLTRDNVEEELRPGDRFEAEPNLEPVSSVRPHTNGVGAMVYFADGSRDMFGLPQTVRIIRD